MVSLLSAFTRSGIVTMAVTFADAPVFTVNDQLALLIASDLSRDLDRLALRGLDSGRPFAALAPHRPALRMRNYVLIRTLAHITPPATLKTLHRHHALSVRAPHGWAALSDAPADFSLVIRMGSHNPLWIMKNSESSRGDALRRTLLILRDLMRGKAHDRHTAAELVKIKPAAADRRLSAMAATIPGVVSKVLEDRRREYRFDSISMLNIKRPTKQAVVAACFGASLGSLFEGTYKAAMREPLSHLVKRRRAKSADIDRKFWFVRRGGEGSLPDKEDLLHELIDALLEQNVTEIEYEHFDGVVNKSRILPLSVVIHDHQLYFIAQNEAQEIRFYRFSRTNKAERLDDTFVYPLRTTYDPDQILRDSFGIFIGDEYPVENVRVRLSARWGSFARSHRWHPSQQNPVQTTTGEEGHGVELHFRVRICPEFESWILGFGEDAEVLAPESLRTKIAQRTRRSAAIYNDKKNDV